MAPKKKNPKNTLFRGGSSSDFFVGNTVQRNRRPWFLSPNFIYAVIPFSVVFLICAGVILYLPSCRESEEAADWKKMPVAVNTAENKHVDAAERFGIDIRHPVRSAPDKFPRNASMPTRTEAEASGAISGSGFSPGRDLVYVDDSRVWWESDNDGDTDCECDHTMHKAMEIPFRRLVNLVDAAGWQLRVQDTYRPTGIHSAKSLHREGRAIDITMDREPKISDFDKIAAFEELSKLAWQAGFDWVFFEYNRGNGPHVHASVRRNGKVPPRELRDIWESGNTK